MVTGNGSLIRTNLFLIKPFLIAKFDCTAAILPDIQMFSWFSCEAEPPPSSWSDRCKLIHYLKCPHPCMPSKTQDDIRYLSPKSLSSKTQLRGKSEDESTGCAINDFGFSPFLLILKCTCCLDVLNFVELYSMNLWKNS